MAKLVKVNGFEIKINKKEIQEKVDVINNALQNNENLQGAVYRSLITNSVDSELFNKVFYNTSHLVEWEFGHYGYTVTNIELKSNRTIYQMVGALVVICDELIATYDDVNTVDMLLCGYRPNWYIKEKANEKAQNIHNTYRDTQKKIVLLDLIYLALYELQTITIAREWVGTNEFDFFDDDVASHDFTCAWFNFWLRCFNKDFLNACKIRIGILNHKLNKEIEFHECETSYAAYLFYLKEQVKYDYKRLRGC